MDSDPRTRMLTPIAGAAPWQQLTPTQSYFRDTIAGGRYQADKTVGASVPINAISAHPDGTVDTIRLEPHGNLYLDLGGKGATDTAAGHP
jgi:hypothetical protein